MKLMIIESAGKIKKLNEILGGGGWKIAASVGHIRDLPEREIGVSAETGYRPAYELTERGADVVKRLKGLVREADEVYLATDPDREGEAIAWHLQQCLGLKSYKRVTWGEVTPGAVQAGLAKPRLIDSKFVASQEGRRVLDRLVGYKVSPKLRQQSGQALTAGRVQTPAVRLVVERERAIRAFRVTNHFGAALSLADERQENGGGWSLEWQTAPEFVTDDSPYFMDRAFAQQVADVRNVTVTGFEQKQAQRQPPAAFETASLQQAASVALGFDPEVTMKLAQKLYEGGHITYHRTDNPNLSEESMPALRDAARAMKLDVLPQRRTWPVSEDAQAGHPAIAPTHWEAATVSEGDEQALYALIRNRAIASQLAAAVYKVRTVTAEGTAGGKRVTFAAAGRTLVSRGWLALIARDDTKDQGEGEGEADAANPIPELAIGDRLVAKDGVLLEKKTKAPPRFTKASLVERLKREGIGRPATYAAIMANIERRGYVGTAGKHVVPTQLAEVIVDAVAKTFSFADLAFTRQMESELDKIAKGTAGYAAVIRSLDERLDRELAMMQVTATPAHPCPSCGKPLRRIDGAKGPFWSCTDRAACNVTMNDEKGKPVPRKQPEVSKFACLACGKPLIHRVKTGRGGFDFFGCSGFKDGCKTSYPNQGGKPDFQAKQRA